MPLTLRFVGVDRMQARLAQLAERSVERMGNALRAEAEIEMTEAKKRTPVDTGALRASGHVDGPFIDGRSVRVTLNYGGPAVPYAAKVHEDLEAFHRVGQAKFLESVLNESGPHIAARVARRMRLG